MSTGLFSALKRQGHGLADYSLDGRLNAAGRYLRYAWQMAGSPKANKPTAADSQYMASWELPYRARRLGVDWVLVVFAKYLHPDALVMCHLAGIRTAVVFTESPFEDAEQAAVARIADLCWTNERTSVEYLRQANPHTYYLPHAFDPANHHPGLESGPDVPAHDVVFVGTGWPERVELLGAVDWTGIDFGLYGAWNCLPSRHRLRKHLRAGIVSNSHAAALYRRAKIGLNFYRTCADPAKGGYRAERSGESMNPRALELAACGAFTISDRRPEVAEVFGDLVPAFAGPAELDHTIRRWLGDDVGRQRLAAALPAAVSGRTFDAMAEQVVAQLQEVIASE